MYVQCAVLIILVLVISFSYAVDFEAGGNAQRKHFYWIDGGAREVLAPRKKNLDDKEHT